MKKIRGVVKIAGGLILMFSGMYFIAATLDSGIIITRAGVAMARTPFVDMVSSLSGTLEFFLGLGLVGSALALFGKEEKQWKELNS